MRYSFTRNELLTQVDLVPASNSPRKIVTNIVFLLFSLLVRRVGIHLLNII